MSEIGLISEKKRSTTAPSTTGYLENAYYFFEHANPRPKNQLSHCVYEERGYAMYTRVHAFELACPIRQDTVLPDTT